MPCCTGGWGGVKAEAGVRAGAAGAGLTLTGENMPCCGGEERGGARAEVKAQAAESRCVEMLHNMLHTKFEGRGGGEGRGVKVGAEETRCVHSFKLPLHMLAVQSQ